MFGEMVKRRNLDLNLLMAFDVLMKEMSVSRAAEKMFMTQSAMSHTLNRLRQLLDDPLLVRTSSGMKPTSRAQSLIEPIRNVLQDIDRLVISPPIFDPKISRREFVIAATDYAEYLIVPSLIGHIKKLAPQVNVSVEHLNLSALEPGLENGDIDVALGFASVLNMPTYLRSQPLFEETMACVVRKDHPEVGEEISLERYVDLEHISVSISAEHIGLVDEWLSKKGLNRRVTLKIPHFLTAPFIVAQTDMMLSVPKRVAEHFIHLAPLKLVVPPMELPANQVVMAWHPVTDKEASCIWLRAQIQISTGATVSTLGT